MKFNAKKLTQKGQGVWTVEINGDDWKNAIKKGKSKVAADIEIPGFRKGKVPKAKVEQFLTPAKYLKAAIQVILEDAWEFASAQKSEIQPFTSPVPTPVKISEESCTIDFVFDLKPEIEIGKYTGIKAKELVKQTFEATAEEIDGAIEQYQSRFALEKDKEDLTVAVGDVVVFDFEGFIDDKPFKGGKGLDFRLVIGSKQMIPGFEDAMIGKKIGESTIAVTFPEDYTPELSGKKAKFILDIKTIKQRELPAKDDELAKDLNLPNINTYKELVDFVTSEIIKQKTTNLKNQFVNQVIDIIIANSKIELPKIAIDKEVENLYKEFEARVASQKLTMKDYKKQTGLTDAAIKEELVDDAKRRISSHLVTDKVRNNEKFEFTPEEVAAKYEVLAKQFGVEAEMIKGFLPEDQVKEDLIKEKIIDFLYQNNG
ncbi:trigger factor [Spiroplasma clarkii]|uniref:Trigger factor n=1 Tax=Spiroplasma clarkii TaxID=2139 RepID=A0A1Y0L1U0_9MOLU|nr:trigger factor [Spiroplasma clarkii]ARU91947.1 trigger factor [Spiroplasma clarkii]ATX71289.1 trigger factor [Spiroplasma clarkii]